MQNSQKPYHYFTTNRKKLGDMSYDKKMEF